MNEEHKNSLWSRDVELALLASILGAGNVGMDDAAEMVRGEWFFAPLHRDVWDVMRDMWARREPIDLLTLTVALRHAGVLEKVEAGAGWVTDLNRAECVRATIPHWADITRDYWRRREVKRVAAELMISAQDFARSTDEMIDAGEKALLDLRLESKQTGLVQCGDAVHEAVRKIELAHKKRGQPTGLATGFADLDRMTSGLQPGNLIIIAARPSMGKSALATNIAENVCLEAKVPTALFSLEMTASELMERVLAGQSGVPMQKMRNGFPSLDEMRLLGKTAQSVGDAKLFIDETPSLSIAAFRARARRAVAMHGVKLIIVDYLQLMKGATKRAANDRRLEIDEISAGLKATAKELEVPVIALSQLNRDAEERAEPKLSHLRESGSIEQDADVVALLHRPERVTHDEEDKGKAVLILAKQRNGPVGRIELEFDGEITRFKSVTERLYSNNPQQRQRSRKQGAGSVETGRNFRDTDGE
jgi:replicative DNA helicase